MVVQHLFSAGSNARGQLAIGSQEDAHTFTHCIFQSTRGPTAQVPGKILQITCGSNHTVLLLENSDVKKMEVWGCGDGSKGQLGPDFPFEGSMAFRRLDMRGDLEKEGLEGYEVKMIAVGWETSYITWSCPGKDDILTSMGANDFGALGVGKGHRKSPAESSLHVVPLQGLGSDQPHTLKIESLSAGPHHVVVRVRITFEDGSTKPFIAGWGTSRHGQLGPIPQATLSEKYEPFHSSPHVVSRHAESIVACALGNQHTVLLDRMGTVVGLGSNRKSQISGIESWKNVSAVGCTWNGTYGVAFSPDERHGEFSVLATGSNNKGQLGVPEHLHGPTGIAFTIPFSFGADTRRLMKVVCGSEHMLGLFSVHDNDHHAWDGRSVSADIAKERSEVWAWGWNEHGNLGTGDTNDVRSPRLVWPSSNATEGGLDNAVDIWAGCGTSWILVEH